MKTPSTPLAKPIQYVAYIFYAIMRQWATVSVKLYIKLFPNQTMYILHSNTYEKEIKYD